MKSWNYLLIVALLLSNVGVANAQTKPMLPNNEHAAAHADLIKATLEYKANSEDLLQLQEARREKC